MKSTVRGRQATRPAAPGWVKSLLSAVSLGAIWWVIAGGAASSWIIGVPAVLASAWAARRLGTGRGVQLSFVGLLRFIPFFAWESLRGGVDVALRTLGPCLRVRPGFAHYQMRLANPSARVFFANCASLLPGTLAAELEGDWLTLHALSTEADGDRDLRRLERAVARLFSEDLEAMR